MDTVLLGDRSGAVSRPIIRHRKSEFTATSDEVVEETPIALVFNGISHAVMMATPIDLEHFALGFAISEGIVDDASEVYDIDVVFHCEAAEVHLTVAQRAFMSLKGKRRALAGRSGCGVCGIESLDLLDLHPEHASESTSAVSIDETSVARAAQQLPHYQVLMRKTGGIHAAAWCSLDGSVIKVFEDVGRHNALDKLIGYLARERMDRAAGFVFLSSRASYELVRKAARLSIHTVATISAPTSLAISIAEQAGIRLLSFCRGDGFVEYVSQKGRFSIR